jgi:ethanolamine ammonia-lyase small subunit
MAKDVTESRPGWDLLRSMTPARIGLARTGLAISTRASLDFQLAHAQARDAVAECFDLPSLVDNLAPHGLRTIPVSGAAHDRRTYLLRPDLGRMLDESSRIRLAAFAGAYDLLFVIADGLSAPAVMSHASPMIGAALSHFPRSSWKVGPLVIAENGRVAIGDDIGQILGAQLVAVLIGERPGLSSPDSLGIYLTFAPHIGCTDAERNCLSNIRLKGMSYADAARKLAYLCCEARRRKLTGVQLKESAQERIEVIPEAQHGPSRRSLDAID